MEQLLKVLQLKSALQAVPLIIYPAVQVKHCPGLPNWQVAQGFKHVAAHEKVGVNVKSSKQAVHLRLLHDEQLLLQARQVPVLAL
jgi:hypothetical protein